MNVTCTPVRSEEFIYASATLGYLAGILLIASMVSQMRSYYVSKDVSTLSYGFIGFQTVVNGMYLTYNASIRSWPTSFGNSSMIVMCLILLAQKIYYTYYYRGGYLVTTEPESSDGELDVEMESMAATLK